MGQRYKYISYDQRKTIAEMWAGGARPLDIAEVLGVHVSSVYHELRRGVTGEQHNGRDVYDADIAQTTLNERFKRRGRRKINKVEAV